MLTEYDLAKEQLKQFKLFLTQFLEQSAIDRLPEEEHQKMVDFMLDKILEARERVRRFEELDQKQ